MSSTPLSILKAVLPSAMVMLARVGMGAKAPWPMLVTLAGMLTPVSWVPANAWVPMAVKASGSTILPPSWAFSKALWPIDVSALGKVNDVSPVL